MMDQKAFKYGVGIDKAPRLPSYKCKKGYYKQLLNQALRNANVSSMLGGVEYSEKIVNKMKNINLLGRQNAGFRIFLRDLRKILRLKKKITKE